MSIHNIPPDVVYIPELPLDQPSHSLDNARSMRNTSRSYRSRRSRARSGSDGYIPDIPRLQTRSSSTSSCTHCGSSVDAPHFRRTTSRASSYNGQYREEVTHEQMLSPPFIHIPSFSVAQPSFTNPLHASHSTSSLDWNTFHHEDSLSYGPEPLMHPHPSLPVDTIFPYKHGYPSYASSYMQPSLEPSLPLSAAQPSPTNAADAPHKTSSLVWGVLHNNHGISYDPAAVMRAHPSLPVDTIFPYMHGYPHYASPYKEPRSKHSLLPSKAQPLLPYLDHISPESSRPGHTVQRVWPVFLRTKLRGLMQNLLS